MRSPAPPVGTLKLPHPIVVRPIIAPAMASSVWIDPPSALAPPNPRGRLASDRILPAVCSTAVSKDCQDGALPWYDCEDCSARAAFSATVVTEPSDIAFTAA